MFTVTVAGPTAVVVVVVIIAAVVVVIILNFITLFILGTD